MTDERVGKTLGYSSGKCLQLALRQIQSRDHFVVDAFFHEGTDQLVVHALLDSVHAIQVSSQYGHSVGAVQNPDLTGTVRSHVVSPDHVQANLVERKLFSKTLVAFDNPQVEDLSGVQELVLVAQLFSQSRDFVAGVAGYDTVNQSVQEVVAIFDPSGKIGAQVPLFSQAEHNLLQVVAVAVDQLARNDHETLVSCAVEGGETLVQKHSQLAGEGGRRSVVITVLSGVCNAGFGGVGDHEAQLRALSQAQVSGKIFIWVNSAADGGDNVLFLDDLAVLDSAQQKGVQAVLVIQHRSQALGDRLNHGNPAVEQVLLVQLVDHPIHEAAQEVAFTELQYFLRQSCNCFRVGQLSFRQCCHLGSAS
ncbi:hypothetical protein D3C75_709170 [compost metagenome]